MNSYTSTLTEQIETGNSKLKTIGGYSYINICVKIQNNLQMKHCITIAGLNLNILNLEGEY